jgi:hypothetical protein
VHAAEHVALALERGASEREIARALAVPPEYVVGILEWRASGYRTLFVKYAASGPKRTQAARRKRRTPVDDLWDNEPTRRKARQKAVSEEADSDAWTS